MARSRDIRRCALQALYQFDAGCADTPQTVRDSLDQSSGDDDVHEKGFELAVRAWALHEEADAVVAKLAPDWPTYRQPVVDRSILRLAYFEITSPKTPSKVAINEAVELAKEFSTQKSPLFINGVLDKIYKSQREVDTASRDTTSGGSE